jgi:heme-degrading monooxygenase HmoA
MWKLKEYANGAMKDENARKMKAMLESCKDIVLGIKAFEVAICNEGLEATCDVILYSEFESKAALAAYQLHPQHEAIKPFIAAVREERHCMDYEVN